MHESIGERVPVVLIVDDQEWRARSLESVFGPAGFAVVKAYTGRQSADLAHRIDPDLVIADFHLPDCSGCDVIRAIRSGLPAQAATPCVIISATSLSRSERHSCFEAGAWDIATTPIDPSEILLKANTYVQAKRSCDSAMDRGLLDAAAECYNFKGLMTRLSELASDAVRAQRPMACVVLGMGDAVPDKSRLTTVVRTLGSLLRSSDALGRLSQTEFAVVAPGTDGPGALTMAQRMTSAFLNEGDALPIGVYAIPADDRTGIRAAPEEMLSRAIQALRIAQRTSHERDGSRISSFQA